jgi:hypothetical protein
MVEAHASMRDDFAARCVKIDALVEMAMQQEDCFGARITGGGFGGCTVNLVRAEAVEGFCCGAKEGARGEDRNDCGVRCERSNRWCAGASGTRRCAIKPIVEKNPHRRFNPLTLLSSLTSFGDDSQVHGGF